MNFMFRTYLKIKALPFDKLFVLGLIALIGFMKSFTLAAYDIGVTSYLLGKVALLTMPMALLSGAVLLSIAGYYAILIDRRQGYGAITCLSLTTLLLAASLAVAPLFGISGITFLFAMKYGLFLLGTICFWSVAARFINMRFESLKFTWILTADFGGFILAGILAEMTTHAVSLMYNALFGLIGVCLGLLYLGYQYPIPNETFIKKQGGAQQSQGKHLFLLIGFLAVIYMALKIALDLCLYDSILSHQKNVLDYLGLFWMLTGALMIGLIALFRKSYFLYTTSTGIALLAAAALFTTPFVYFNILPGIFILYVLFHICAYFYTDLYFKILPRPLTLAHTRRIKTLRLILLNPLGIVVSACFFFYFDTPKALAGYVLTLSILFIISVIRANRLYADILLYSFKNRLWRGSPLMIEDKKVFNYVLGQLAQTDTDNTLYFLRVLEEAFHPKYQTCLLQALKNNSAEIRKFALIKLARYHNNPALVKTMTRLAETDPDDTVKQTAIRLLIRTAYDQGGMRSANKYLPLLNHREIQLGALIGFLRIGKNGYAQAFEQLTKLATSKKITDQLRALTVMQLAPQPAMINLLIPLLNSTHFNVKKESLLAAAQIRNPQTLSFIFESLDDTLLQETALLALKNYGKRAFPPLEKMLYRTDIPDIRKQTLILFLGELGSGEGKQILIRALDIPNQKLRRTVMQTLIDSNIIWVQRAKQRILKKQIGKDVERVQFWLTFLELYGVAPTPETEEAFQYLNQAVWEDIRDTRILILYQLQMLKPHPLFQKAIHILQGTNKKQYLTALGVIQDFLPNRLYQKIKSIALLPMATSDETPIQRHSEGQIVQSIASLLTEPPFDMPPWIQANALYCLRKLGDERAMPAVVKGLKIPSLIVSEAAIYALYRLEPNKHKQNDLLINMPTAQLLTQLDILK